MDGATIITAATTTAPTPNPSSNLLFETCFLMLIRSIYFFVCRHFVNVSLLSDLKSVIREDGFNPSSDSPERQLEGEEMELEEAEKGYFPVSANDPDKTVSSSGGGSVRGKGRMIPGSTGGYSGGRRDSGVGEVPDMSPGMASKRFAAARQQNYLYPKLSTTLFCLSFSESCMLFTLLLFGEAVGDRARSFNWSLSLLALLSLIIFIIPLGLCLLLTHRTRTTPAPRTIFLTMIPFSLYLFLFYRVGSIIASLAVVSGSHSSGLINGLLSRVCVPGVCLIASLSGGGAVNTAWQAFEWRSISSAEPVTDQQILVAERSLYRARLDIHQRTKSLTLATSSAAREAEATASSSLLSRWTTSTPAAKHLNSLQVELKSMESMESEMMRDLIKNKKRKELREMGRTFKGRIWLVAGWCLSVYCVWRVFFSCINLIFGYSQGRPSPSSSPLDIPLSSEIPPPSSVPAGTDLLTSLIGRLAVVLDIDLDIATWSRLIGLVLVGSIILANMRHVLGSISRVFKATSTGVSSSFMLLLLAELMSLYLLTSLISLPSSPTASTTTLLDTLPSFQVFSRLFDSVFLIAAGSLFGVRWIERKIRPDDDL